MHSCISENPAYQGALCTARHALFPRRGDGIRRSRASSCSLVPSPSRDAASAKRGTQLWTKSSIAMQGPGTEWFLVNSGTRKIEKRPRSPDGPKLPEKERANVGRSLACADNKSTSVDQIRVVSGRWYTDHQGSSLPASRWCKCALKFGLAASCITADPLKKYDFVFAQKSGTALHPERNNAVPTALGRLLISSPSRWVWARQYRLG